MAPGQQTTNRSESIAHVDRLTADHVRRRIVSSLDRDRSLRQDGADERRRGASSAMIARLEAALEELQSGSAMIERDRAVEELTRVIATRGRALRSLVRQLAEREATLAH